MKRFRIFTTTTPLGQVSRGGSPDPPRVAAFSPAPEAILARWGPAQAGKLRPTAQNLKWRCSITCVWLIATLSGGVSAGEPAGGAASDLARTFAAECAAKAAAAEAAGSITVVGKEGWLFLAAELHHLGAGRFWGAEAAGASMAARPERADPIPAILDFKRQLDAAGVELLVVPVPAKAAVYPDRLSDALTVAPGVSPPRLDATDEAFCEALRAAGVAVADLAPPFLADRFGMEGPLFCKQDSHWSGNGCVVAAREIAGRIKGRPWLKDRKAPALASQWRAVEVAGDLVPPGSGTAPEKRPARFVGIRAADGGLEPLADDRAAPIVLLGDSSNLVFHTGGDLHAVGAGLPDQLALELGLALDVVAVRGSGATAARINFIRRIKADPNYLKGKRLVIWCFAARELTEGDGWRPLPLAK
jgi:hypothetical protein